MKSFRVAAIALVALSGPVHAQGGPAVTPEMKATESRLLTHVGPETRAWIRQQAAQQNSARTFSGKLDASALRSYPYASSLGAQDIEALTFLVMMEASRSANADLKAAMGQIKKTNSAKDTVRRSDTQQMAELQTLRLQATMDRKSKMLTVLSNMMKKTSDSNMTIVQNLK